MACPTRRLYRSTFRPIGAATGSPATTMTTYTHWLDDMRPAMRREVLAEVRKLDPSAMLRGYKLQSSVHGDAVIPIVSDVWSRLEPSTRSSSPPAAASGDFERSPSRPPARPSHQLRSYETSQRRSR